MPSINQPETDAERKARQAKAVARYDRIYSEVEAEHVAEWEEEFGVGSSLLDYVPNGCAIHAETQRRVELEQRHDAEEAADALR